MKVFRFAELLAGTVPVGANNDEKPDNTRVPRMSWYGFSAPQARDNVQEPRGISRPAGYVMGGS